MDRQKASKLCRELLDKHSLNDWKVALNTSESSKFVGLCDYKSQTIILNALAIDIQPEAEVIDTIKHEVAHAIVGPNQSHNLIWVSKAEELGARTTPCAHLSWPEHVLDAIRSGHNVEMTMETIQIPKYKVTRLQDKCPECGKVAVEKFAIESVDTSGNQVKLITLECFHIIKKIIPKGTPFEDVISNFWQEKVKNCIHQFPSKEEAKEKHIPSNRCLNCLEYKLYPFQVIGARFIETALSIQRGAGCFDDMGLGKTVQGLINLRFHADLYTPCMVVTKSALKFQWFKQSVRWLGPEFIAQIISTSRDYLMPGLKMYIIPYDLLRRFPREKLHALGIKLVILDEVQQIKNPDSTRTQEVRKLVSANPDCKVIELSGTPWKNRGGEFFPALNLIDPVKFYSHQHFLDTWVEYYWHGNKRKMGGIRNPQKFREFVSQLIIRREYNEVMDEFPDINRMKLPVQLDELQQSTYDDSESEFVDWYNQFVIGGEEDKVSGIEILAQMARMRHVTGLAKIPATLSFIEEFVTDTDKKLVVFVHHKDVGQLMVSSLTDTSKETNPDWYELAQLLEDEGVDVFAYTSAHTGKPEGYELQERFNTTKRCVMVASTLACGEGLDLQTCADSVLHERQWNPQNEDQATPGRFRRIGQESGVINITCPEAEGTIDEDLDFIVEDKRKNFHKSMNKGDVPVWNENDFAKELAERIVAKHKAKKAKSGKGPTKITQSARLNKNRNLSLVIGNQPVTM